MSKNETLQDILQQTVQKWLKDGIILKRTNAPLHAERTAGGRISRGSFKAYLEGRRIPDQDRVFEGLEAVTGVRQERLISAAQRWEPPAGSHEALRRELEQKEARLAELEAELETLKAERSQTATAQHDTEDLMAKTARTRDADMASERQQDAERRRA